MAGETTLTVQGNLTSDPELRFTPAGHAVAAFTVAATPRTYDKSTSEWRDGDTLFMRCSAWRQLAENIADSLTKGTAVVVVGTLKQRSYDDKDGTRRTVIELEAHNVAPSLLRATAKVTKASRNGAPQTNGYAQQQPATGYGAADPWTTQQPAAQPPF